MSENAETYGGGGSHGADTDPQGTTSAGDKPGSWHPAGAGKPRSAADMTDEERQYNRKLYGLTWGERYGARVPICVTYCLVPGQRKRGTRCPCCFQEVEIRPIDGSGVEPGAGRMERFTAWVGGWVASFCEAVMFPFRAGRAHTEALVRDILRDALADALAELREE